METNRSLESEVVCMVLHCCASARRESPQVPALVNSWEMGTCQVGVIAKESSQVVRVLCASPSQLLLPRVVKLAVYLA